MKKFNYIFFHEQLEVLLAQDVISHWQALGPGHYRLNGEIDVWPKNQKFHILETDQWGSYAELKSFLLDVS